MDPIFLVSYGLLQQLYVCLFVLLFRGRRGLQKIEVTWNVTFESAQLCLFLAGLVESRFFEPLKGTEMDSKNRGYFSVSNIVAKGKNLDWNHQKGRKIGTPLYNVSL